MKKKQLKKQNISKSSSAVNPERMEVVYDFSKMEIDELLESVRADIDSQKTPEEAQQEEPDIQVPEKPISRSEPEPRAVPAKAPPAEKKKRRPGFYRVLLMVMAAFLVLIAVGTFVFWKYIEAYEISLPDHVIKDLQENIDYDFWENAVYEALTDYLSEFEKDKELSSEPYLFKIRDVKYTIREKSEEKSSDSLVYIIRAGSADIGTVRLIPARKVGFGYNMWEIGSIELLDSFIGTLGRSITVTASQNAQIELNGIPVSQEYRTDCIFEYGATYKIKDIYGVVEVKVFEWNGQESMPYHVENDEYYYRIIKPFSREFNVLVPEGSHLFVSDVLVSTDNIAEKMIVPAIFEGVIDPSKVPLLLERYVFEQDGFYAEPVVTATDTQGELLISSTNERGEISFNKDFSTESKTQHSSAVEAFIRSYVRYSANIGNNIDANFANLSGYILQGTELYGRVQGSLGGVMYVSGTTVEYDSLEIDNFRQYGDDYFTCEVRYSLTHRTHYEARKVDASYELLFVKSGGRWLAAKMISI